MKDTDVRFLSVIIGKRTITFYTQIKRGRKVKIGSFDEMQAQGKRFAEYLRDLRSVSINLKNEEVLKQTSIKNKLLNDMTLREFLDNKYYDIEHKRGSGVYVKIERAFKSLMNKKFIGITKEDIKKWKETYNNRAKQTTLRNYATHLKRVYNYAIEEGYIDRNPFTGIKFNNDADRVALVYSDDELNRIYNVAKGSGLRNATFIATMMLTGARPNELFNCKIEDIDYNKKYIKVNASFSKSHNTRYLYFSNELEGLLKKYIKEERDNIKNGYLFVNSKTGEKLRV